MLLEKKIKLKETDMGKKQTISIHVKNNILDNYEL